MIFEKRGKYCFRDENGRLHKFATEQEAAKAAGLGEQWEFDHGSEEAEDVQETHDNEETDDNEEKTHYDWLHEEKESDTKE